MNAVALPSALAQRWYHVKRRPASSVRRRLAFQVSCTNHSSACWRLRVPNLPVDSEYWLKLPVSQLAQGWPVLVSVLLEFTSKLYEPIHVPPSASLFLRNSQSRPPLKVCWPRTQLKVSRADSTASLAYCG